MKLSKMDFQGKKIEKFEDLEVWQEGMRMVVDIYKNLADCKDYGLRDQIQRAAVSIPSNISCPVE